MQKYYYLVHIQYLGYRFHGWQKQPVLKTVEFMIEKTTAYVLGHTDFKILGCSRTDARVSASHSAFELFVNEPLDTDQLLKDYNNNFPNDIRATKVETVDETFNIINGPRMKEYLYFFSFGAKNHPFCAPLMFSFREHLDIELMKEGAQLFQGRHNFVKYCTQAKPGKIFEREVQESKIEENTILTANFFPADSYVYRIKSKGFMRYQVRLMMGQLLCLGRGEIGLDDIRESLKGKDTEPLNRIAPSSGLVLNKVEFC